jgi:hypothetical protein
MVKWFLGTTPEVLKPSKISQYWIAQDKTKNIPELQFVFAGAEVNLNIKESDAIVNKFFLLVLSIFHVLFFRFLLALGC